MTRSRILIVEDEVIVANNLKRRLEELDYDIPAIVFSGRDAIQKADEVRPDLVLIDIKLEGTMDGVESAQRIRERFDIPVIYLTGYADTSTLERAKITEPYGYILKPFEIRELHSTIEMALYKHQMERRLRESERRYRTLVEHSLQGLMVVQGAPPRVIFANSPCEEITGYSVDELLAMTPDQAVSLIHPDDREYLLAMLAAHLADQPVPSTGEFRVVRNDEAVRWVEYFASLVQHDGSPAVQAAFVDITDRRHAQEVLRRAHDDLEQRVKARTAELEQEVLERRKVEAELTRANTLLSALNEMSVSLQTTLNPHEVLEALGLELRTLDLACVVALLEPDAQDLVVRYVSIEPEALASLEEWVGSSVQGYRLSGEAQPLQRLVREKQAVYLPDPIAVLSAQFPSHSLELLNRALQIAGIAFDGPAIYLPLSVKERLIGGMVVWGTSLREADLPALSIFASQVAISFERVRLTQEAAEAEILRELDRLRSELIANVSHEIRTPLGLIEVSCTSLLMDDVEFDQETQRAFLRGIREETERLKAIVENLLNLGRMESGRWQLHRRETDLSQLASEVMAGMEVHLDQHRFVHDFPPAGLVAMVDRRQIEQVLRNLLSNAIRYSPEGGVITVHGHGDGRRAVVSVSDEGVGIPIEEQECIFERFYRVDSEITHKVSGVGLGLAVCRGIVESHGGRIWVESMPGQGSSFHLSIPLGTWASERDSTQKRSQAEAPHFIQPGDTV